MASNKSISQWSGVAVAVLALPFVGSLSCIFCLALLQNWGIESAILLGLMLVLVAGAASLLIAWIVSKLVGFIIS